MFAKDTKCTVKSAPSDMYQHMVGSDCKATDDAGSRGTGSQRFDFVGAGAIYGNGDTGFVVTEK